MVVFKDHTAVGKPHHYGHDLAHHDLFGDDLENHWYIDPEDMKIGRDIVTHWEGRKVGQKLILSKKTTSDSQARKPGDEDALKIHMVWDDIIRIHPKKGTWDLSSTFVEEIAYNGPVSPETLRGSELRHRYLNGIPVEQKSRSDSGKLLRLSKDPEEAPLPDAQTPNANLKKDQQEKPQATPPDQSQQDTPDAKSLIARQVGIGGMTYRVDGNDHYLIWNNELVIIRTGPGRNNGVSPGLSPNKVCIGGDFKFVGNETGVNRFGDSVNVEVYEPFSAEELKIMRHQRPERGELMTPLVAAPGIPEFTSLKAMEQRLKQYNIDFERAIGNGIRLQQKAKDAQNQLRACVGHTVTWEFKVINIIPAGVEHGGHLDGVAFPGMVTVSSGIYGLSLVHEANAGPWRGQECLEIGTDISEEYASKLSKGDTIRIRGTLTKCEFEFGDESFIWHGDCSVNVKIRDAVVIEENGGAYEPLAKKAEVTNGAYSDQHEQRKASVPGMKTCTELRLPAMLDTVP